MLERVLALTREYDMLPAGGRVLCAVSGGADSVCLLHLLRDLAGEGGFTLCAAHFDHQLRGEESRRDAAFVENLCKLWNIPLYSGSADVAEAAKAGGRGIEETARALRYDFLRRTAEEAGADRIATAHNADDNAETLLLHLVRGSGLQGLTGIAPRRGALVRPLLTTPRAEIEAYLEAEGLAHVEDSSNADQAYTRNFIRRQVMPLLRQCNPRLTQSVSETIACLRADNDYLNAQAFQACQAARWAEEDLVIEAGIIAALPNAVAPRAARRLLEMTGDGDTSCSAAHLNAIVDLCRGDDPSAVAFLPHGRLAQRIYRELLITTQDRPARFAPCPLDLAGTTAPAGALWTVSCRPAVCPPEPPEGPDRFFLARAGLEGAVMVRPRAIGDEIALPRRSRRRIKKLMIDEKLPRRDRDRIPVLADGAGVLALAGFGPDAGRLARPGEDAYEIAFAPVQTPPAGDSEREKG